MDVTGISESSERHLWGRSQEGAVVRRHLAGHENGCVWRLTGPCGVGKKALLQSCWNDIHEERCFNNGKPNKNGFLMVGRLAESTHAANSFDVDSVLQAAVAHIVGTLLDRLEDALLLDILHAFCLARSDWDLLHEALNSLALQLPLTRGQRLRDQLARYETQAGWNKAQSSLQLEQAHPSSAQPFHDAAPNAPRIPLGLVTPPHTLDLWWTLLCVASTMVPLCIVLQAACESATSVSAYARLSRCWRDHGTVPSRVVWVWCDESNGGIVTERSDRDMDQYRLDNLSKCNVETWVNDWLTVQNVSGSNASHFGHGERATLHERLVDVLWEQTLGNPQHMSLALQFWKQRAKYETWEELACTLPSDLGEWYRWLVQEQDDVVRRVVETTAALGQGAQGEILTIEMLETILQESCVEALATAHARGLLDWNGQCVVFANTTIQRAAYQLIPDTQQCRSHYRIGRRLWKSYALREASDEDDANVLFLIAQQLQMGAESISDLAERTMMAQIQWQAGKVAMKLSLFARAAWYMDAAIVVLRDDVWNKDVHDLSLALHNGAAEASYCAGDFVNMECKLNAVFEHVTTLEDKLQAYTTLVFANGARHRAREAVSTALDVLNKLQEPLPNDPSKRYVMAEYVKTRRLLKGKTDRFFCNLPNAQDHKKIAAMTMLSFAVLYSYPQKPECGALALFRSIQLATEHGVTTSALTAFSLYGVILANTFMKIDEGYRYGQIALRLLDQVESRAWLPRVYFMVYGLINNWVHPFRECFELLLYAQRFGLRTGDMEGSVMCGALYLKFAINAGKSLSRTIERNHCASFWNRSAKQPVYSLSCPHGSSCAN